MTEMGPLMTSLGRSLGRALRIELDLRSKTDRLRLLVSGANWSVARLLSREVRRRGDLEWAIWRIPVARLPGQARKLPPRPSRGKVLWIPGWGDSPMSWLAVLSAAFAGSDFEEIVALDFPGFHGSLAHRSCITDMDRILEVARDTVQEFRPEVVAGHSLGGWLAAWSLIHLKDGIPPPKDLLLISPSGVTGGGDELSRWKEEFRSWTESNPEDYLARVFAKAPPVLGDMIKRLSPFMVRQDSQEFLNSVQDHHYLEDKLHRLESRVSLLWGAEDGVIPERYATQWIQRLPNARYDRWTGVGHMPHMEAPLRLVGWLRSRTALKSVA